MDIREIFVELRTWTPFLAGGFLWNIIISFVSMTIGTLIGAVIAFMRASDEWIVRRPGNVLTEFSRGVPTFVFLFYLAYLLPSEVTVFGTAFPVPAWLKASLALSIAVVGFVSDNLSVVIRDWRAGRRESAVLFLPSWTTYFLIIVMSSSTASVIGVSEIVSRANTVIGAINKDHMMIWIYLYAMGWFFCFCYPLTLAMNYLKEQMKRRLWVAQTT
jgi:polar amino acid transport system permease protein